MLLLCWQYLRFMQVNLIDIEKHHLQLQQEMSLGQLLDFVTMVELCLSLRLPLQFVKRKVLMKYDDLSLICFQLCS
jgi:hypothetical protein